MHWFDLLIYICCLIVAIIWCFYLVRPKKDNNKEQDD